MGKPYSMDLRERVVAAIEGGHVDASGGGAVFDRDCDGGRLGTAEARQRRRSPAKQGKPKGSVLDAHADFILGALAERPT